MLCLLCIVLEDHTTSRQLNICKSIISITNSNNNHNNKSKIECILAHIVLESHKFIWHSMLHCIKPLMVGLGWNWDREILLTWCIISTILIIIPPRSALLIHVTEHIPYCSHYSYPLKSVKSNHLLISIHRIISIISCTLRSYVAIL